MILEKWLQNAKLSKTNLPLKINEFLSNKIKLVCDITKREVLTLKKLVKFQRNKVVDLLSSS
jgi:hypothetical protein